MKAAGQQVTAARQRPKAEIALWQKPPNHRRSGSSERLWAPSTYPSVAAEGLPPPPEDRILLQCEWCIEAEVGGGSAPAQVEAAPAHAAALSEKPLPAFF